MTLSTLGYVLMLISFAGLIIAGAVHGWRNPR